MVSEEDALRQILTGIGPLPKRQAPLAEASACFSAEDFFASVALPAFDNSAMDGYAVRAADCKPGVALTVVGEQPAGVDRGLQVSECEAIRIFTGAPLPAGVDAVVMQEDVTRDGSQVVINTEVEVGDFIRSRGCDLAEGQKMFTRGQRLRPVEWATLASQGATEVWIGGTVSAAVLSTGDELIAPGAPLEKGQIYDSNSVLIASLLRQCGAEIRLIEHCPDHRGLLRAAVDRGIENNVLIITGGVSVGEHDLVKTVLLEVGADIELWQVAIKPGKPFLFGRAGECRIFGLPGNPVSSFVTFLKFVRPAILRMMGGADEELPLRRVMARLAKDVRGAGDRPHYIRGKLESGMFAPAGRQESHALFGLSQSNALLRVEVGAAFRAGELVEVELWD
ncbi:MAG: gephyrin-like molybdotransferase Glp [Chthoniobacterales bacterium]